MLAYICKNCGKFTIVALENEFKESFCCMDCYIDYCKKNNYEPHIENLKQTKNMFIN